MAFLHRSPVTFFLLLTLTSVVVLTSPVRSLNCASQTFTNNHLYTNCTHLPTLNSSLHWTFLPKNSSLSIAFISPPPKPDGWISWAINPTRTGMAGSQALMAFKNSNGSMAVKTYNISSYSSIVEGKISFEVPESSAEFSGGIMRIFATVRLPETMTEVNHVWQVGGSVVDGVPGKHEFMPANLKAIGKLQLTAIAVGSPVVAPTTSSAASVAGIYGVFMGFGFLLGFW